MTNDNNTEQRANWQKVAQKHLLGKRIIDVRWMTRAEQEVVGWHRAAVLLILDDGSVWWPSADDEGNDAGALFGEDPAGNDFTLPVI